MTTLNDLYQYADHSGISIFDFPMSEIKSLSTPDGCIALDVDRLRDSIEEKDCLAHEIGHIATGAFYNIYSALDLRQKHENHADRWAIRTLVPKTAFWEAVNAGLTCVWELADYFDVSERLILKAADFYKRCNL